MSCHGRVLENGGYLWYCKPPLMGWSKLPEDLEEKKRKELERRQKDKRTREYKALATKKEGSDE